MDATKSQLSDCNDVSTKERIFETSSQANDLLSRVSSFLPQIRAANSAILMVPRPPPLLYQEDGEDDETGDESDNESEVSHLIHEIDQGESPTQNPNGLPVSNNKPITSETIEARKPSKKRKLEFQNPTIVMDLHFNQNVEHPLFQLLCGENDKVEDDATESPNLQPLLGPSSYQSTEKHSSSATVDLLPDGTMLLPHEQGKRSHPLISVIADESNDYRNAS
jgi:hypothetical protein